MFQKRDGEEGAEKPKGTTRRPTIAKKSSTKRKAAKVRYHGFIKTFIVLSMLLNH